MQTNSQTEVWMRGPVAGVPSLLQPVAHALLQAAEEVERYMDGFDDTALWQRPAGVASVGFHLQHIAGVIDRLFTYALDESLTDGQLAELRAEGADAPGVPSAALVDALRARVDRAVQQLTATDETALTATRYLGRKRIPTTLIGLLFHAAEHTQRHVGQLLVTSRLLMHEGNARQTLAH